ncbi:MAG: hypothetical protein WCH20_02320 [Nitrospira sp.]
MIDVEQPLAAAPKRLEALLKNERISLRPEEPEAIDLEGSRRVVLVAQMAVRAQRQKVQGIIVAGVLVDVMDLRAIAAADGTSMVELLENSILCALRDCDPLGLGFLGPANNV